MKKLIKYPSTEHFKNVVANVNRHYNLVGLDETGKEIYDLSLPKPVIRFKYTTKIHGSNDGVSYNNIAGFWIQSRENIITIANDNAGFAFFVESNKEVFMALIKQVAEKENIDLDTNTITIYGEWAGKGVQGGVGVSKIPKSSFTFGVKVSPIPLTIMTEEESVIWQKEKPSYWVDYTYLRSNENRIYNIDDFGVGYIDIDFNMPQLSQNELIRITVDIENECPVAKHFGFPNEIGEGIVLVGEHNGQRYLFKSKGEKHSSSKVKTLNSVDVEQLNSIVEFIEYTVTENRFNQALQNVFPNDAPHDIKKLGDVIRWVVNDIIKEEMDTMVAAGLEPKQVNGKISEAVRKMFFTLPVDGKVKATIEEPETVTLTDKKLKHC